MNDNNTERLTPLTDAAALDPMHAYVLKVDSVVPTKVASDIEQKLAQITEERDEMKELLADISAYLSVGSGDETTTPQQYRQRIFDGMINHNKQMGEHLYNYVVSNTTNKQ